MTLIPVTPSNMSRAVQVFLKNAGIIFPRTMRNFQTDLSVGKEVTIGGIGEITIGSGTKAITYQKPPTYNQKLKIDQDKYFAVELDDASITQSMIKLEPFLRKGANSLAADIDATLAELAANAQYSIGASAEVGATELIPLLSQAMAVLKSSCNESDYGFIDLYVGPFSAQVLNQIIINKATTNDKALMKGYIGEYIGFNVFEAPVKSTGDFAAGTLVEYNFATITRNALGCVVQDNPTTEIVRLIDAIGDGLRGRSLYGCKNIAEKQFVSVVIKPDLSD